MINNIPVFTFKLFFFSSVYFIFIDASYSRLFDCHHFDFALPSYIIPRLRPYTIDKYSNNNGAGPELISALKKGIDTNIKKCSTHVGFRNKNEINYIKSMVNVNSKKQFSEFIDKNLQEKIFDLGITNEKDFASRIACDMRPYIIDKKNLNFSYSKGFSDDQRRYLSYLMQTIMEAVQVQKIPRVHCITTAKTDPVKMIGATGPSLTHSDFCYDIFLAPQLSINELTAVFIHEVGHLLYAHPHLVCGAHEEWNRQRSILNIMWNHKKFLRLHNRLKQACEMVADTTVILELSNSDIKKALNMASCIIETYWTRIACEKIKNEESGESCKVTNVLTDDTDDHPAWGLRIFYMLKLFEILKAELDKNSSGSY